MAIKDGPRARLRGPGFVFRTKGAMVKAIRILVLKKKLEIRRAGLGFVGEEGEPFLFCGVVFYEREANILGLMDCELREDGDFYEFVFGGFMAVVPRKFVREIHTI